VEGDRCTETREKRLYELYRRREMGRREAEISRMREEGEIGKNVLTLQFIFCNRKSAKRRAQK